MTKANSKPKKRAQLTPTELYEAFIEAVQKAEGAKSEKTRKKWIKSAEKDYAALLAHSDELSTAKVRRAKRSKAFLSEIEAAVDLD